MDDGDVTYLAVGCCIFAAVTSGLMHADYLCSPALAYGLAMMIIIPTTLIMATCLLGKVDISKHQQKEDDGQDHWGQCHDNV